MFIQISISLCTNYCIIFNTVNNQVLGQLELSQVSFVQSNDLDFQFFDEYLFQLVDNNQDVCWTIQVEHQNNVIDQLIQELKQVCKG